MKERDIYDQQDEIVEELLQHGAEMNSINDVGWTPVNSAAGRGHVKVAIRLLNANAKVDLSNYEPGCKLWLDCLCGTTSVTD